MITIIYLAGLLFGWWAFSWVWLIVILLIDAAMKSYPE